MLNDSFILDSEATCYVYNDKSRFIDFRLPTDNNVLYASESIIPIKGFGTVLVIVTTLEEPKQYTMYLYNIIILYKCRFFMIIYSKRSLLGHRELITYLY
jgi:hypothetical protein